MKSGWRYSGALHGFVVKRKPLALPGVQKALALVLAFDFSRS
jgi:hypothetical protein